jgi:hypothetical protein
LLIDGLITDCIAVVVRVSFAVDGMGVAELTELKAVLLTDDTSSFVAARTEVLSAVTEIVLSASLAVV